GFTSLKNGNGTASSARVGARIATATNDASGTWTNAAALVCLVYRASPGNVLGIGAVSAIAHAAATGIVNFPALSLVDPSGGSWIFGAAGVDNTTQAISTAPAGMANQSLETAAAAQAAGFDTGGGVSSWSSTNATDSGTAGDTCSCTVEIMELSTGSVPSQFVQHVGGGGNPYT